MPDAKPKPVDELSPEPIPISALQHAVYCLRQAALIHMERLWAENRFTAEGHALHSVVDKPGMRKTKGVRRATGLPLASTKLGIAGMADLVEFHQKDGYETPYPIEYKRGKSKLHRADEVQLCAQAFCLEDMTGQSVPEGALFYAETKRRVAVPFDKELRELTLNIISQLKTVFASMQTPPPTTRTDRCRACSLYDLCRPKDISKPVKAWREHMTKLTLEEKEFL
ncbi:MAG: CRISPR-associated protein Cas4 [Alphaproteobacteria bacterium]|nr:CRISPR-associated protein Cas4 [Alphaproteobacteria bacterium]